MRLTQERLCRVGESAGELTVLHELTNMTIKDRANRGKLDKVNPAPAGFDPLIGQARHAEDPGSRFLRKPQRAAPAPQCGADAGLCIFDMSYWSRIRIRAKQPRAKRGT